jgi:hypothetical protein
VGLVLHVGGGQAPIVRGCVVCVARAVRFAASDHRGRLAKDSSRCQSQIAAAQKRASAVKLALAVRLRSGRAGAAEPTTILLAVIDPLA